jgi:hypothetical protein
MSDNQPKKGRTGKVFKLFLLIVVVLLIPLALDQADVDREQVRLIGRIAAGVAGLMFLYGLFAKLMKAFAFVVVLLLIAGMLLVSERQVEMPRLKELLNQRAEQPK